MNAKIKKILPLALTFFIFSFVFAITSDLNRVLHGDVFYSVINVYSSTSYGLIFFIFPALIALGVFFKTQEVVASLLVFISLNFMIATLIPHEFLIYNHVITAFASAIVLYYLLKGKK